jgi:hypothetical protein
MRDQVSRTLREFGLEPKGKTRTYQKPYPEFFDNVPYPRGFVFLISLSSQGRILRRQMSM